MRAKGLLFAIIFGILLAPQAKASFIGFYAIASGNSGNWVLTNTGGGINGTDGSFDTPDSGATLVFTGGNDGSGNAGTTTFLITAPASGLVQFDWSYTSTDSTVPACVPPDFSQICDTGGYLLDNSFFFLADDTTAPASGTGVSFSVTAGQVFGFEIITADNSNGPGILTLTNFNAPQPAGIPEPGTAALLLGGTAMILGASRWKIRSRIV